MIFRRSNDTAPAPSSGKTSTSSGQGQGQRQSVSAQHAAQQRREPELSARTAYQPSSPTPTAPTQPVSPLAMAQARRTPSGNPMANFGRQEQLRKLTVGRDISLNGEITTCDHLIVEGSVKATIKGGQVLEIAESGTFEGVVDIEQAEIAGTFEGDLIVRNKLVLRPTANVTGTIRYGALQVDTGARLVGEVAMLQMAMQQPTMQQPHQSAAPQQQYAQPTQTAQDSSNPNNNYDLASVLHQPGFLKASA